MDTNPNPTFAKARAAYASAQEAANAAWDEGIFARTLDMSPWFWNYGDMNNPNPTTANIIAEALAAYAAAQEAANAAWDIYLTPTALAAYRVLDAKAWATLLALIAARAAA